MPKESPKNPDGIFMDFYGNFRVFLKGFLGIF